MSIEEFSKDDAELYKLGEEIINSLEKKETFQRTLNDESFRVFSRSPNRVSQQPLIIQRPSLQTDVKRLAYTLIGTSIFITSIILGNYLIKKIYKQESSHLPQQPYVVESSYIIENSPRFFKR